MRGADVLAKGLVARGVDTVFALSGNQIMPLFDALFDTAIRVIHVRHEAACVHMAEAHAQLTGGVGVALVTAGAGLGNAAGALIAARASDTPLLLLSGDSPAASDGRGAFQEMDQMGVTRGLAKGARRVMRLGDMARDLGWALHLARTGRPGPVHLALPADVLTDAVEAGSDLPAPPADFDVTLPDLSVFEAAARPVILLGPALNATRAPGLAQALCTRFGAPVLVLESPRGLNDPSLGRLAQVAARADCVLALGKAVDFTLGFGAATVWPSAAWHLVLDDADQIESARGNLGDRLASVTQADPSRVARVLSEGAAGDVDRGAWIDEARELVAARVPAASATGGITPQDICAAVQRQVDRAVRPIVICDGGEFGQWAQAGVAAPRRVLNGVSGVIGGGLGYAIGARAADPAAQVFALMGDGTMGFHIAEFETAAREGLPFVAIVGNDRRWNAEHLIQTRSFGAERAFACDLSAARYDLAVAALGGFGVHVTEVADLDAALAAAVSSGLPACVNVELAGQPAPTLR